MSQNINPFGRPAAFGGGGQGNNQNVFGQGPGQGSQGAFGAASQGFQQNASAFGGGSQSQAAFGAPSTGGAGGFGPNQGTAAFGQAPQSNPGFGAPAFGAAPQNNPQTSAFGNQPASNNFQNNQANTSQAAPAFGAPSAGFGAANASQPVQAFGGGSSAFGSNQARPSFQFEPPGQNQTNPQQNQQPQQWGHQPPSSQAFGGQSAFAAPQPNQPAPGASSSAPPNAFAQPPAATQNPFQKPPGSQQRQNANQIPSNPPQAVAQQNQPQQIGQNQYQVMGQAVDKTAHNRKKMLDKKRQQIASMNAPRQGQAPQPAGNAMFGGGMIQPQDQVQGGGDELYPLIMYQHFEHAAQETANRACGATARSEGRRVAGFLAGNTAIDGFGDVLAQSYALNTIYSNEIDQMGDGLTQQEKEEAMMGIPTRQDC